MSLSWCLDEGIANMWSIQSNDEGSPAHAHNLVGHHPTVYALQLLEQQEHLRHTYAAVVVKVALQSQLPHLLVTLRRTQTHHQTQFSVGVEKLLPLQLPRVVHVVAPVNLLDVLL